MNGNSAQLLGKFLNAEQQHVEEETDLRDPPPKENCCLACGLLTVFPGTPAVTRLGGSSLSAPFTQRPGGQVSTPWVSGNSSERLRPAHTPLPEDGRCLLPGHRAGQARGWGEEGSLSTYYTSTSSLRRNSWAPRPGNHSQLAFPPHTGAHTQRAALAPCPPRPCPGNLCLTLKGPCRLVPGER